MNQFLAVGTIASDIVRKETRKGVAVTFRLRSGEPGRGQLWVDIEAWGHLAGTIHQHATPDRVAIVGGRLAQRTWQDHKTGDARSRYVIVANDIDLIGQPNACEASARFRNTMVVAGTTASCPTERSAGTGHVTEFKLAAGRAGSKTGRLWIDVEHWHRDAESFSGHPNLLASGSLAYGRSPSCESPRYYLEARSVEEVSTTNATD